MVQTLVFAKFSEDSNWIGPVMTICLEATHDGEKAAVLTKKGGDSINSARHAKRHILVEAGQTVHLKCRRHLFWPQKKIA